MPELQVLYDEKAQGQNYEEAQRQITDLEDYAQLGKLQNLLDNVNNLNFRI